MSRIKIISIVFLLLACRQTFEKTNPEWQTIEVGNYVFDFPSDFKLVEGKGIDSYVGKIQGDSIWFGFNFGYYSGDFEQTTQEYLEEGFWRSELSYRFMKQGMTYTQENMPEVDILNIRSARAEDSIIGKGCDYIAICKHEEIVFNFAVFIPDEIKQLNFSIDTVDQQYRKIVWAKDPQKGTTGIYLRDLKSFNESINSYLALSMATSKLTAEQQELVLKIFKTGRPKNKQK